MRLFGLREIEGERAPAGCTTTTNPSRYPDCPHPAVGGSLTLLLFTGGPNWIFVSYVGILGWVPLGVLCAWIVLTGQLRGR